MYSNYGVHMISRVEGAGKTITLNDNSKWEVSSIIHRTDTMLWLPTEDVRVEMGIGQNCKLTHTRSGKSIEARFLG